MKKQSRTVIHRGQSDSQPQRHLPLVDILVKTQTELQALVVASGLKVLDAMLEEDRVAVCGPRYAHQPERRAYRAGHAPSEVVLGGRKVAVRRPRVRRDGQEVSLPTVQAFTNTDPLTGASSSNCSSAWRPASMAGVWNAGRGRPHAGDEQECGESAFCGADPGAIGRVAGDPARRP